MTKSEALGGLKVAWKKEQKALAEFLRYLVVVDRERYFLEEAYSSLERFLREGFGMTKSSALKRIGAARVIARFPVVLEKLEAQELHLTAIVMLSPHLTEDNCHELVEVASGKSESQLERELAKRFPQRTKRISRIDWHSDEEATLHLTIPARLVEKIERLAELRKKAHPSGDIATLLEEAVDHELDRIDPLRKKVAQRKAKPDSAIETRRIRRRIQTEVWHRDQGQCTFQSTDGKRCGERAYLEIDHRVAWAQGGSSKDISNLRLLCSAHNRFLARRVFGSKVPTSRPVPGA